MDTDQKVLALFIDFENIERGLKGQYKTDFRIEPIIEKLSEVGAIRVRKAYADWVLNKKYREPLMNYGLELIEKPAIFSNGKNGADIKLAIDSVEIAINNPHINTFAIVSGDSDFLSLIQKLRELGKYIIIISGEAFTSKLMMKNCDEFISYELIADIKGKVQKEDLSLETEVSGAIELLRNAIRILEDEGKKTDFASIKFKILQLDPSFTEKKIGFSSFGSFIKSVAENKQLDIEVDLINGIWYVKSNSIEDDNDGYETRTPTRKEWKIIIETLQTFFEEGRGKKTEGNAWILYAYLNKRRSFGLLPLSKEALDDAVQVLISKGLLIQHNGEDKYSPYSLPDDFEQRKNVFLEGLA